MDQVRRLRDALEVRLLTEIPEVRIHGADAERLPNTCLVGFAGLEGEALQLKLAERGICVSTGSACSTGMREPSHVLRAMGVPDAYARGTIRLSLGRETTSEEMGKVMEILPSLVAGLRGSSPFTSQKQ
jgi:cysteine desulfurase